MKLATLVEDEGFVSLFERLIASNPKQIIVFEPDLNPAKTETDIYFWFPCGTEGHIDCGYFVWVVAVSTAEVIFQDIEMLRTNHNLTESEVIDLATTENFKAFNLILNASSFYRRDVPSLAASWLAEWVNELKDVPIRLADPDEYQRRFAMYEEYHISPEVIDPFFNDQRAMITNEYYFNGKMITREEYINAIDELVQRRLNRPPKDGEQS